MARLASFLYGGVAYAIFFVTFIYAIGFVGNLLVPKSIDSGPQGPVSTALLVNTLLLGLFAVQHSVMARPVFKKWWARIIPRQIERSTFVLFTNLVLLLIFWQWQPIGSVVWQVQNPPAQLILNALFWFGFLLVLVSTFLINHFDLFGLRQVYLYAVGSSYIPLPFRTTGFYKLVRHPLLLGFIIAFWSTPLMTTGHLLFAGLTTAYMLIAIQFEEHDLENFHGEVYRRYRSDVPMLIPWKGAPGANLPRESAQNPASEN